MGLDMYLERHTYVKNWTYMKPEERTMVTVTRDGKPVTEIDPSRVTYIVEEVGYWRKANAIHAWFVEHVQDSNDDCTKYPVSHEQLEELLDTVNRVLEASSLVPGTVTNGYTFSASGYRPIQASGETVKDPTVAEQLLPTSPGSFFGSTDYDQYYIDDLRYTKEILEAALQVKSGDYYYRASW